MRSQGFPSQVGAEFDSFDPNVPQAKTLWGFYDGRFRTYATRGPAINAARNTINFKLYKQTDHGWELVVKQDGRHEFCDGCAKRIEDSDAKDSRYKIDSAYAWRHNYRWDRDGWGRLTEPLTLRFLCAGCLSA